MPGLSKRVLNKYFWLSMYKWQIKLGFIIAAFFIFLSVILYTLWLVDSLVNREKTTINMYAAIFEKFSDSHANSEDLFFLINSITPTITFPMIATDKNDNPNKPYELYTKNIRLDTALSSAEQDKIIIEYLDKMKQDYEPVIVQDDMGRIITKFYYTNSTLVDQLKLFPFVVVIIISIFILVGYIAFSNIRHNEESRIWVGMAKEAAHQLGTPLSSLLAWIEILKYCKDDENIFNDTLKEMEKDVNRLNIIAIRFSKIGSQPEKKLVNLKEHIETVCNYFERRLPHLGRKIDIIRHYEYDYTVNINGELFDWVLENLLKNAAEAIENKKGRVEINVFRSIKNNTIISIKDNGKGMTANQKRRAFFPGYSTKKRGWGLGLSLSQRIIEEYHNGKIFVKVSSVNEGTTFFIELPLA